MVHIYLKRGDEGAACKGCLPRLTPTAPLLQESPDLQQNLAEEVVGAWEHVGGTATTEPVKQGCIEWVPLHERARGAPR
jgi:hypothetical protein